MKSIQNIDQFFKTTPFLKHLPKEIKRQKVNGIKSNTKEFQDMMKKVIENSQYSKKTFQLNALRANKRRSTRLETITLKIDPNADLTITEQSEPDLSVSRIKYVAQNEQNLALEIFQRFQMTEKTEEWTSKMKDMKKQIANLQAKVLIEQAKFDGIESHNSNLTQTNHNLKLTVDKLEQEKQKITSEMNTNLNRLHNLDKINDANLGMYSDLKIIINSYVNQLENKMCSKFEKKNKKNKIKGVSTIGKSILKVGGEAIPKVVQFNSESKKDKKI